MNRSHRKDSLPPPSGLPVPCIPLSTVRTFVGIAYLLGMTASIGVVQIVVNWT